MSSDNKKKKIIINKISFLFSDVKIQYCGGRCPSVTSYDETYPHFTKKCKQCKVSKSEVKQFVCLKRGTNLYLLETYNNALECECRHVV